MFFATGSADHKVRVYLMSLTEQKAECIFEANAYTKEVTSIQCAHVGLRFISGSNDGSAHVWYFESLQWKSLRLNVKLKVTAVAWDPTDKFVVTAVENSTVSGF